MEKVRFDVWVGGGIGELHEIKVGLTFKAAVKAWVAGQKRCPTDCSIEFHDEHGSLRHDDEDRDWLKEELELDLTIQSMVAANRQWVEQAFDKQHVYNRLALEHRNPFTRG